MSRRAGELANERAQKVLRDRERIVEARDAADLRFIMASPEGRRFIWGLIEGAGTYGSSFAVDPHSTAFNEGRRSVGLGLMSSAKVLAPDLYVTALREQLTDLKFDEATREAAESTPEETPDA